VSAPEPPVALIAEVTHRCPLQCPYCSNPLELERSSRELDTAAWRDVFGQAAAMGVLHLHLTGGEPMARADLNELVSHASGLGLYTNLITSAVLLDEARLGALADAGLDHVQISFQGAQASSADKMGGYAGGHEKKLGAARLVKASGLALTLNFVVHRGNLDQLPDMFALAIELGAGRIEIAHVQYYGWALMNRSALLPSRQQVEAASALIAAAREELRGRLVIDHVEPDYYAARPKPCMGGWARRFINVSPSGKALPCHAAETLPGLDFPNVLDASLAEIWNASPVFERFRGTDWMPEPCRSCDQREIDWGGCRCQAFALAGDASRTDPACALSPDHAVMARAVAEAGADQMRYRRFGGAD
jgi:pyrroloquinoline quinone biosynthesis protein E